MSLDEIFLSLCDRFFSFFDKPASIGHLILFLVIILLQPTQQLKKILEKLELLTYHFKVPINDFVLKEVKAIKIQKGSTEAIKLYRKLTKCGLKEAKNFIDALPSE
jgi:hypothetical protein